MAGNNQEPASVIAMVRPASFGYNEETAADNFFQKNIPGNNNTLQQEALAQFDAMVLLLRSNGVEVLVLHDSPKQPKPDAVFPNNWFTCMDNRITVFPMHAGNRRKEKDPGFIDEIKKRTGLEAFNDSAISEESDSFLEGTGSMVIDHSSRIIYACISVRTNERLLREFAEKNNYLLCVFEAADEQGRLIYHTNVLMCIGDGFAVVCSDAIRAKHRASVIEKLTATGHEIIDIRFTQMNAFAGNMLQLSNNKNEKLLVLSKTAFGSLMPAQLQRLEKYSQLIVPDVSVIEQAAGGSVRCMMAELFF